jgi:hypothetical protein
MGRTKSVKEKKIISRKAAFHAVHIVLDSHRVDKIKGDE